MQQFDYETVQRIAVHSLRQFDADLIEQRSTKEVEREAHKFASVIVDVFNTFNERE
jgi:hypothetical protein